MSRPEMHYRHRRYRNPWPTGGTTWKPNPTPLNEMIPLNEDEPLDWFPRRIAADPLEGCYEGGPLNLHGYLYHPATNKYYKITQENGGINGFSRQDMNRRTKTVGIAEEPQTSKVSSQPVFSLNAHMRMNEIGKNNFARISRDVEEMRVKNCSARPTFSIRNPIRERGKVIGCDFLDISESGDHLVGSFPINTFYNGVETRAHSALYTFEALSVRKLLERERDAKERKKENWRAYNTMGLVLNPVNSDVGDIVTECADYAQSRYTDMIVDQTLAFVDQDVTCMITVTAAERMDRRGAVRSYCTVHLSPLEGFSNPDRAGDLDSPIYNKQWREAGNIWSVGWNADRMSISFGCEQYFRMENILTDQVTTLSSKRKNVISHCFNSNGTCVMMGIRGGDVIRSDLRMNRDGITGHFRGSKSSGYVKVLKEAHPDCLLTESFDGKIRLYDSRRTEKPLMVLEGHKNKESKVPCFVDHNEKFVFAVGNDGIARGWSLVSGELLCSVKTPPPQSPVGTHFPQVVYSDRLCGRAGNSALILASNDSLRVHVLDL